MRIDFNDGDGVLTQQLDEIDFRFEEGKVIYKNPVTQETKTIDFDELRWMNIYDQKPDVIEVRDSRITKILGTIIKWNEERISAKKAMWEISDLFEDEIDECYKFSESLS